MAEYVCFSTTNGLYLCSPPRYSLAISLDSSRKSTFQSAVPHADNNVGGVASQVSMKLRRTPLLHCRLLFLQLLQCGMASSHLRWRSRHVKQPVRTRLGLLAAPSSFSCPSPLPTSPFTLTFPSRGPTRLTFLLGLVLVEGGVDLGGTCADDWSYCG